MTRGGPDRLCRAAGQGCSAQPDCWALRRRLTLARLFKPQTNHATAPTQDRKRRLRQQALANPNTQPVSSLLTVSFEAARAR